MSQINKALNGITPHIFFFYGINRLVNIKELIFPWKGSKTPPPLTTGVPQKTINYYELQIMPGLAVS